MIFEQYSITSTIVDYLNLSDLDNFKQISIDVVEDCCRLKKRKLLKNRWLKIDRKLSKHPSAVKNKNNQNENDLFFWSHYGLCVFVTIDKPDKKLNLNIQSVFGTKIKFDYDLPDLILGTNYDSMDKISCCVFKIPPFFSTRNKISHIVRSIIEGEIVFWDLNFIDDLSHSSHSIEKPEMIIKDGYDSDDENDYSLSFKMMFGDELLSTFSHLTKLNEKVDFGSFGRMEYSYNAETFVSEIESDVYFYDDLINLDAVVVKFHKNRVVSSETFREPFKDGISFTVVLEKRFYFVANSKKTEFKIFELGSSSKPLISHEFPSDEKIINLKYVCDDIVMIFSKNQQDQNLITMFKILKNEKKRVPDYLQKNLNFDHLCLTFEKDEFVDNILVMFIDIDNVPQSCYLLE